MLTLFVTLVLAGASLSTVVASDPSDTSDCIKKGILDPEKNPISWMSNGSDVSVPPVVPTQGHFHIWNLVSTAGDSLLKLAQDERKLIIACSGSFSQDPAEFQDSTVYPTLSVSIKFQARRTTYYLSIHPETKAVLLKDLEEEALNNYARLVPWLYQGFVMFESKSHPDNFLGCTKDGAAQLFYMQDKRYPDPRALFIINSATTNTGGS